MMGIKLRNGFLYFATIVAALSGLLFGYDTGVVSGAVLFLKIQYHLSATMEEIVTGVVLVGAILGALGSGRLADRLGRRTLMIATAAVFLVGVLVTAFAPNIATLIVGRIVVGVGIGIASYLGPLYISEISPASKRGGLVALNQLLLTLGILISYFVDYALSASGRGAGCSAWRSCLQWRSASVCCSCPRARVGSCKRVALPRLRERSSGSTVARMCPRRDRRDPSRSAGSGQTRRLARSH